MDHDQEFIHIRVFVVHRLSKSHFPENNVSISIRLYTLAKPAPVRRAIDNSCQTSTLIINVMSVTLRTTATIAERIEVEFYTKFENPVIYEN